MNVLISFLKNIFNRFKKETFSTNINVENKPSIKYYLLSNASPETIAIKYILNSPESIGKLSEHSRPKRIKNIGNISIEEFKDIVSKIFNIDDINILSPGENENPSQGNYAIKFPFNDTYVVIVLGRNEAFGLNLEKNQVDYINNFIRSTGNKSITLLIGKYQYYINGAKLIKNNKHADIVLLERDNRHIYIQYKSEIGFQQYSGIENVLDKKEVKYFVNSVKNSTNEIKKGEKYQRSISYDLKLSSVYGVDTKFSENKVQVVCFGDIKFNTTNYSNIYSFSSNKKYFIYPEIPVEEYEPIIGVRFASDRNQCNIKNARFGFYPKGYFKSAKEI